MNADRAPIISCASCTTNCITSVIEVARRRFGVERAVMTSVHAYTAGQLLLDGPSSSFRLGRAGAANLHNGTTRQLRPALRRAAGIVITTAPHHLPTRTPSA